MYCARCRSDPDMKRMELFGEMNVHYVILGDLCATWPVLCSWNVLNKKQTSDRICCCRFLWMSRQTLRRGQIALSRQQPLGTCAHNCVAKRFEHIASMLCCRRHYVPHSTLCKANAMIEDIIPWDMWRLKQLDMVLKRNAFEAARLAESMWLPRKPSTLMIEPRLPDSKAFI